MIGASPVEVGATAAAELVFVFDAIVVKDDMEGSAEDALEVMAELMALVTFDAADEAADVSVLRVVGVGVGWTVVWSVTVTKTTPEASIASEGC